MKLAFSNPEGAVFEWSEQTRKEAIEASRTSPRKRMLVPIHRRQGDLVQRMVNILQTGSYVQPHQHPRDSASETIMVMEGELGFVVFSEEGDVISTHRIGVGELIDIDERVWHGVIALAENTLILEVKRGPYDDSDKVFAEWAPAEGDDSAPQYLRSLESLFES